MIADRQFGENASLALRAFGKSNIVSGLTDLTLKLALIKMFNIFSANFSIIIRTLKM